MASKVLFNSPNAPVPAGPYSHAVRAGDFVFVSGQVGIDPGTGQLQAGLEAQTRQALANMAAVLQEAGSSLSQLVKTTIFLTRMADFPQVNAIYGDVIGASLPARSTVGVQALPLKALVEIEAVALGGSRP